MGTGFQPMPDDLYNKTVPRDQQGRNYGSGNYQDNRSNSPVNAGSNPFSEAWHWGMQQAGLETDPDALKNSGYQAYNYQAPNLNQGDFTSAQAANAGMAPQGRSMVQNWQASQIDPRTGAASMAAQNELMRQLQMQASGRGGPSAAQQMFFQANDAAAQNAARLAAGQRANPSQISGYQAQQAQQQGFLQAGQQAAIQRAQEQLNAQNSIQGLAAQMYGQQFGLANANAGYQQQANQSNAGAYNQQLGADYGMQGQYGIQNAGWQQQANMNNAQGRQNWATTNNANNIWAQNGNGRQQESVNDWRLGRQKDAQNAKAQVVRDAAGAIVKTGAAAAGIP